MIVLSLTIIFSSFAFVSFVFISKGRGEEGWERGGEERRGGEEEIYHHMDVAINNDWLTVK